MENQNVSNGGDTGGIKKQRGVKVNPVDVEKLDKAGADEASFDELHANPSRDIEENDKSIDIVRSKKVASSSKQQEQQQAGIPTSSSSGDAAARRAGMNSGTQGIGTGSAQGYEGNTDDSGLPNDYQLGSEEDSDEDLDEEIEVSQKSKKDVGSDSQIKH